MPTSIRKDAILVSFDLDQRQFKTRYEDSNECTTITVHQPGVVQTENNRFLMGYIKYDKKSGHVVLVNASSELHPKHLELDESSKSGNDDLAGCHGEGFKLAALAMCRNNHKVLFAASNYYWSFEFCGKDMSHFSCTLEPATLMSRVSESSTVDVSKTLSKFAPRIWKDVSVMISSVQQEEFSWWLDVLLDIRRPVNLSDSDETAYGDLIIDPNFAGKVYLKGLRLPASGLCGFKKSKFGYNFLQGNINRDRQRLRNQLQEAQKISQIWEAAIDMRESVLPIYVNLLQKFPHHPDVHMADSLLKDTTRKKIWDHLRRQGDDWYFYYCEKSGHEVRPEGIFYTKG